MEQSNLGHIVPAAEDVRPIDPVIQGEVTTSPRAVKQTVSESIYSVVHHFCGVCEGPGNLVLCDGTCKRGFHATCVGLDSASSEEKWFCTSCTTSITSCCICLDSGTNLELCADPGCGFRFHTQCLIKQFNEMPVVERTPGVCPAHWCLTCGKPGTDDKPLRNCCRCSAAFHSLGVKSCPMPANLTVLYHGMLCHRHCCAQTSSALELPEFHWIDSRHSNTPMLSPVMLPVPYDGIREFSLPEEWFQEDPRLLAMRQQSSENEFGIEDWRRSIVKEGMEAYYEKHPTRKPKVGKVKAKKAPLVKKAPAETPALVVCKKQNPKAYNFKLTNKNIYVCERPPMTKKEDDSQICNCKPGVNCAEDECINRFLRYECDARFCPCNDECTNQRLSKGMRADLKIVDTGNRGRGIICQDDLKSGDLIIEYCGEVIEHETCLNRLANMGPGESNYYFFTLNSSLVIDASEKGSLARFINHSCDPNSESQKWIVQGLTRVGIFARKDIPAGTELTYNYNFLGFWNKGQGQRCHCNSYNCSEFLGQPPKKPVKAVAVVNKKSKSRKRANSSKGPSKENKKLKVTAK